MAATTRKLAAKAAEYFVRARARCRALAGIDLEAYRGLVEATVEIEGNRRNRMR